MNEGQAGSVSDVAGRKQDIRAGGRDEGEQGVRGGWGSVGVVDRGRSVVRVLSA
jgi:hypothetical protein